MEFICRDIVTDPKMRDVQSRTDLHRAALAPKSHPIGSDRLRVRRHGKLFRLGGDPWYVRGLTYGPFPPDNAGEHLPPPERIRKDLRQIAGLGGNAIRVYHTPPVALLDLALEHDVRVFVDVPWEKHRCFLEDWDSQRAAIARVREAARRVGDHPGALAISVGNEIPHDVVRYHGSRRVERFVSELVDAARQEAPDCLVTYTNYPSTEFVRPEGLDFYSANVYLERADVLAGYLQRLQHVAGGMPLVLGEFGVDSLRHGRVAQADLLKRHVREVFRCGLAGSFVFAYTDEWYTGGHLVEDWAFGVTDAARAPKPAAAALREVWARVPWVTPRSLPRASVVVCTYNGGRTLAECLESLGRLDYPDYEVILVDDGSTDATPEIAAKFPRVRYLRQENRGLSAARNAGARAATGEVVAYTDDDCVAEPTWLRYVVEAMEDQGVDAIGGPNVPPASDCWVAKCVAASPGGPSHVMLDDHNAEHVPGCNMAFRRSTLLAHGGFDPQFRQAGDDVDVCWRLLDAGLRIGYAPAALVWHHRRHTARAYLRQQKGYGRAEAMVRFKHPHRFDARGCSRWHGVIYGEGAVGLPLAAPVVYHGQFGLGPFQLMYRPQTYTAWAYPTLLEWHAAAALLLAMSAALPHLLWAPAVMWLLTLVAVWRSASAASLPAGAPWWCRPLVFWLHLAQPVVRAWHRYAYCLSRRGRLPAARTVPGRDAAPRAKRISTSVHDLYYASRDGVGREALLEELVRRADRDGWPGDFVAAHSRHDVELTGDRWHDVHVVTATEELGGNRRFTRVRLELRPAGLPRTLAVVAAAWSVVAAVSLSPWAGGVAAATWAVVGAGTALSRRRCRNAVSALVWRTARRVGLTPFVEGMDGAAAAANVAPAAGDDDASAAVSLEVCAD